MPPFSAAALLVPLALLPISPPDTPGPAGLTPDQTVDTRFDRADGFVPAGAITYAPDLVPYGAPVRVTVTRTPGHTAVAVELAGVAGDHAFPAHVHTGRCEKDPAASGGHYLQAAGSDAADNEVRMTVRTDADGAGSASATVPWEFRPGEAHSLVLHAGTPAGPHSPTDRAACVDVDF
ncbi:superoxide dismutase family protein [Kitasatospora sp. NPDC049285]|uniref:superoxide dismutase family protein n=1 Tax=Kitasatospora sp. NPDC049285 TaxID=3157096 RepID=UPI003442DADA